ncbi:MAG: MipA/OmpV family protein, partial [Emcibacteraceae bacterium]|nr:MipA/OmpV family protein [Emcibacteraceae bacterium]
KITLLFLLSLTAVLPSFAQQGARPGSNTDKWNIITALGPFVSPEFEGAKHYRILPIPYFRASKGNYFVQTEGPGLTANIYNDRHLNFGPSIQYRGERDGDLTNLVIRNFETIDSSIEFGGYVSYQFPLSHPGEAISAKVKTMFDVGNAHNGKTVSASLSYSRLIQRVIRLSLSVSSTYADQKYNNTYFGVNSINAARSGFTMYSVKGGIKDIGGTINAAYAFNQKWGLTALIGYKKLLPLVTDSPIIKNEGTSNQFLANIGVSYRF